MKAFHFLRIAAVITLLYFAGHTAGMPWTPYTNPEAMPILEAMKNHIFEAEGFKGTYWDLYFGFGIIISAFLLVQAAVLWQVASLAKTGQFKLARLAAGRQVDVASLLEDMEGHWDAAMTSLEITDGW